ncbi:MAG: hypothetical protein M1503_11515 [Thaumarchaeota archaeon]|nr:hypothetical protein [Nitrososphaerota archaeon]MCL5318871.1 hypothetical protein [Nitrososphaerota archaeon]
MNTKTKEIVIIALAIVVGAFGVIYLFARPKFDAIVDKVKETVQKGAGSPPSTSTGGSSSPAAVSYPVSVRSPPSAIRQAFQDSGYIGQLQQAIASGAYPNSYLTDLQNDPAGWLGSHSYLTTDVHYSGFFTA